MSYLNVEYLEFRYGQYHALKGVSFSVAAGERLCLLGPSGCGKTTTLQLIAGFSQSLSGKIEIGGGDVSGLPPEKRNIGIMFQNYALFSHMTVFDNVAFGLRMQKLPAPVVTQKVNDVLKLVHLPHAASKYPRQLSGGEQQRIAFARAVVVEPSLLLLDEPFSNLDARLRTEMRNELLELLKPLSIATVMVTHDQEEAMAIADRIAVMDGGKIVQIGSGNEVYNHPASEFVARFVGESNMLDGRIVAASGARGSVEVPGLGTLESTSISGGGAGAHARILVRPERIALVSGNETASLDRSVWNIAVGSVHSKIFLGHRVVLFVDVAGTRIEVWDHMNASADLDVGSQVSLRWSPDDTLCFGEKAAQ